MRLCQTMALATGLPVSRSQRIVVSRWLVTPIAAMSAAVAFASASAWRGRGELRGPDRSGIVLDVSRRGQNLRELLLGRRDRPAIVAENDRPAGSGALVEGQNVLWSRGASGSAVRVSEVDAEVRFQAGAQRRWRASPRPGRASPVVSELARSASVRRLAAARSAASAAARPSLPDAPPIRGRRSTRRPISTWPDRRPGHHRLASVGSAGRGWWPERAARAAPAQPRQFPRRANGTSSACRRPATRAARATGRSRQAGAGG